MKLNWAPFGLCIGLASAAFQICSPAAWAATGKGEAVFLGGTTHLLKPGAHGTLEFHDSQAIVFRSGSPVVRLPYSRIDDFHFSDYHKPSRRVAGLKVPSVTILGRDQVLELSFKDQDGASATAEFKMSERARTAAEALLSERLSTGRKSNRDSAGSKLPEQWWGDKYWKTTRNKASWPDPSSESSPSLAGTK